MLIESLSDWTQQVSSINLQTPLLIILPQYLACCVFTQTPGHARLIDSDEEAFVANELVELDAFTGDRVGEDGLILFGDGLLDGRWLEGVVWDVKKDGFLDELFTVNGVDGRVDVKYGDAKDDGSDENGEDWYNNDDKEDSVGWEDPWTKSPLSNGGEVSTAVP